MSNPKRKMARPRKEIDLTTFDGRVAWRLRVLREKAGLSVLEVAEKLGVSDQAIYSWEIGGRQPKISDLPKISKIYNVKRPKDLLPN